MRHSPYLDEILGRSPQGTPHLCPKCGHSGHYARHVPASPALTLWRWVIIKAVPEHMRFICGGCSYEFRAPVGEYREVRP